MPRIQYCWCMKCPICISRECKKRIKAGIRIRKIYDRKSKKGLNPKPKKYDWDRT